LQHGTGGQVTKLWSGNLLSVSYWAASPWKDYIRNKFHYP